MKHKWFEEFERCITIGGKTLHFVFEPWLIKSGAVMIVISSLFMIAILRRDYKGKDSSWQYLLVGAGIGTMLILSLAKMM